MKGAMARHTTAVTYQLLMAIASASDVAKETGVKMYVVQLPGQIHITHERPADKRDLLARCWPGGRREIAWPLVGTEVSE